MIINDYRLEIDAIEDISNRDTKNTTKFTTPVIAHKIKQSTVTHAN